MVKMVVSMTMSMVMSMFMNVRMLIRVGVTILVMMMVMMILSVMVITLMGVILRWLPQNGFAVRGAATACSAHNSLNLKLRHSLKDTQKDEQ